MHRGCARSFACHVHSSCLSLPTLALRAWSYGRDLLSGRAPHGACGWHQAHPQGTPHPLPSTPWGPQPRTPHGPQPRVLLRVCSTSALSSPCAPGRKKCRRRGTAQSLCLCPLLTCAPAAGQASAALWIVQGPAWRVCAVRLQQVLCLLPSPLRSLPWPPYAGKPVTCLLQPMPLFSISPKLPRQGSG